MASNELKIYFSTGKEQDTTDYIDKKKLDLARGRDEFWCHAELKEAETEEGRFIDGYANTKNLDRMNEIVEPSAFKSSLKAWLYNGVILRDHDMRCPIGKPVGGEIDDNGLRIKAEIAKGVSYVEDTWALIKQGTLRAFSIGYRVLKDSIEENAGKNVRRITDLELFEVSVVSIPANRESLFSVTKGFLYGTDVFKADLPEKENDQKTSEVNDHIDRILSRMQDAHLESRIREIDEKLRRMT